MKTVSISTFALLCSLLFSNVADANERKLTVAFSVADYERSLKTGEAIPLKYVPRPTRHELIDGMAGSADRKSQSGISPFIIGGQNAWRGEYNEFVQVLISDGQNIIGACGGSLITYDKVLTAGHCSRARAEQYYVLPRFYSFRDELHAYDINRVKRVAVHPKFNPRTLDYDVGILTMDDIYHTDFARLHTGNHKFARKPATVVGTGLVSTQPRRFVDVLQKVDTPIVKNSECNAAWEQIAGIRPVSDRMMCAGIPGGGAGSCNGDSGGPLFVNVDGQKVQVGIVSYGLATCELNGITSVYARVSEFEDFIKAEAPLSLSKLVHDAGPAMPAVKMLIDSIPDRVFPDIADIYPPLPENVSEKVLIKIEGQEGDEVIRGEKYQYDSSNSNFSVYGHHQLISIGIKGFGLQDTLVNESEELKLAVFIRDHQAGYSLAKRKYENTNTSESDVRFEFHNSRSSCSWRESTGEFTIYDIKLFQGELVKLIADFERVCDGSDAVAKGSIYFDDSNTNPVYEVPPPPQRAPYPELPELTSPGAVIVLESEAGDTILNGEDRVYDNSNSRFYGRSSSARTDPGVTIKIVSGIFQGNLSFTRSELESYAGYTQRLSVGEYSLALQKYTGKPANGINFGTLSNSFFLGGTASFNIFEIQHDDSGELEKLVADFVMNNGGDSPGSLRGSIRYDMTIESP